MKSITLYLLLFAALIIGIPLASYSLGQKHRAVTTQYINVSKDGVELESAAAMTTDSTGDWSPLLMHIPSQSR